MSAFPLTRRAALAAFGVVALSPAVAVRSALAQPNVRFRKIVVDVTPLRASVGDPTAAWVSKRFPARSRSRSAPTSPLATRTARP